MAADVPDLASSVSVRNQIGVAVDARVGTVRRSGVTELDVTTAPAYEPMEHCITSGRYPAVSDNP